jgi:hypothetical protein
MRRFRIRSGRIAVAVAIFAAIVSSRAAVALDDGDLSDERRPMLTRGQLRLTEGDISVNVEAWAYGDNGGPSPEKRLAARLQSKIDEIARSAGLSDDQKQKLLLAGEGDIHHLIDQVGELKAATLAAAAKVDDLSRLEQQTQPLQAAFRRGPFEGDSLFAKTLRKLLTPDQLARYQRIDHDRRQFQHRAGVHMTVLRLSTALGLSAEQRRRLEQLLLTETRPGRITEPAFPAACFLLVYTQMNRITEAKLRPLFNPWQWRTMQHKLKELPRYAAMLKPEWLAADEAPAHREPPLLPANRPVRIENLNLK